MLKTVQQNYIENLNKQGFKRLSKKKLFMKDNNIPLIYAKQIQFDKKGKITLIIDNLEMDEFLILVKKYLLNREEKDREQHK